MEKSENFSPLASTNVVDQRDEYQALLQKIPKEKNWDGRWHCCYNSFWCPATVLKSTIFFQRNYKAKDSDIILASMPKSGTTWLKSLTFSIINRKKYSVLENPLLTSNPHELVRFLEYDLFLQSQNPDLDAFENPRIFSTHVPYSALPDSILNSKCRIVYICRNPLDQFISHRQFLLQNLHEDQQEEALPIDEAFELFCKGLYPFGPFWDHTEGYWKASLNDDQKVLFLKFEDLKKDTIFHVKKLSEFLGFPFTIEEAKNGMVEELVNLCSLENLKNLEVNKNGGVNTPSTTFKSSSFFRKGEVGDWTNFLTKSMAERYNKIMEEKLDESGLRFELS